ncbi:hypothetical protein BOX15_Mlig015937g2 [Macrostomum lignano]|uniref:Sacsin/Nov domain-containing protein n=1 Tax=Macrostomum lignano TaxID=282301 RepID=A0A267DG25_9PLAT|nr:hypothetical protein BOX15_Mlig015937g2 [Macrostomum lignano]
MHLQRRGLILQGQSESLTDRIRGLLGEYSDGLAVPKELLQNADDAGATELTLVLDTRNHLDYCKSLLDPQLADWQGPSLWAHNDASFTQSDFDNLLRLGGATKRARLDEGQVGKFGLGFNAVYNLTDVPSVLSGHFLQVLDPHGDQVGGGYLENLYQSMGQRQTGVRLDLSAHGEVFTEYKDQLAPYQGMLGCDLRQGRPYRGTLIRLPLRSPALARKSRIRQLHYSVNDAWSLMRQTAEQATNLIMFAQSVRRLRLAYRGEGHSECKTLLLVERSLERSLSSHSLPTPGVTEPLAVHCSLLKAARAVMKKPIAGRQEPVLSSFTMRVKVSLGESLPPQARQNFVSQLSTIGRIRERRWLVTSALGGSEAVKMATEHPSLALSPVGSVAVRLEGASRMTPAQLPPSESAAFCFLPLPSGAEAPPFPVLLNGAFALDSSRRHLLEATGDDRRGEWSPGQWNACLLSGVVAPAYLRCLELLAKGGAPAEKFLRLWPQGMIGRLWEPLARQLNKSAFKLDGPAVFPCSDSWLSFARSEFAEPSLRSFTNVAKHLESLIDQVSDGIVWLTAEVHAAAIKYAGREFQCRILSVEDAVLRILNSTEKLWQSDTIFSRSNRSHFEEFISFLLKLIGRPGFQFDSCSALVTQKVRDKMRTTFCIPDGRGSLKRPADLLSPKCRAASLFCRTPDSADAAMFPRNDLCSDDCVLKALNNLGLRTDITGLELEERAKSVSKLLNSQLQYNRIRSLLYYLRGMKSSEKNYALSQLSRIAFLPVKGDNCLKYPQNLFREHLADLVGLNYDVLDETVLNIIDVDDVLVELGVRDSVSWDLAWQQLQSLASSHSSDSDLCYTDICEAVYRHLSGDQFSEEIKRMKKAQTSNSRKRLVFHETGGFLLPQQVSFEPTDTELPPHLFTLRYLRKPKKCAPFLHALGVATRFDARSYCQALARIHQQSSSAPVSPIVLRSCVELLNCLISHLDTDEDVPYLEEIFAPDRSGALRPCSELCYNNLPWLSQLDPMPGLYFTHKCLSYEICERLGVPTQREQTLRQICEPFGQSENLTTRLEGILRGYPLGIELFKELIQNADDAEATEVVFVNDKRKLPGKQVLSDSWHELQGPALLAFSNSVFTESDLKGIQSLGVGSKQSEAWKTGRFGVGFNCVYNVTDVPQFISNGDTFCVLDPHCRYTHLAGTTTPGAKYSLTQRHKKMFKDALEGFLPGRLQQAGCTIFRLPLRTPDQAEKSKICSSSVSSAMIEELFEEFRSEIASTMLFLTNVRLITLMEVHLDGTITEICVANARASTSIGDFSAFNASCHSVGMSLKQPGAALTSLTCDTIAYTLEISEKADKLGSKKQGSVATEKWMIAQCVSLPQNGSAAQLKELEKKVAAGGWPILPKVGVAARLSNQSTHRDTEIYRVFSLLPLPISTELPVHINGCFVLDPSRRALWCGHSVDAETQWNDMLTCELLPHCYATMLNAIKQQPDLSLDCYCSLLPKLGESSSLWTKMANRLYGELLTGRWALLPCQSGANRTVSWLPLATSEESVDGKTCFLVGSASIHDQRPVLMQLGIPLIVKKLEHLISRFCMLNCSRETKSYIPVLSAAVLSNYLNGPLCARLRRGLPMSVEETAFQNAESVACVIEFITRSYTTASDAHIEVQLLAGTPLNLAADNVLELFSTEKAAFLTSWSERIFSDPNARKMFVHKLVLKILSRTKRQSNQDFSKSLELLISVSSLPSFSLI